MFSKRFFLTAAVASALTVLAVISWSTLITITSLITAKQERSLFAALPAKIEQMHICNGDQVREGDILLQFHTPVLEQDLVLARERKMLLESPHRPFWLR